MEVPKVALLIIATGKYDVFIPPLLESARAFFLPQCDLQFVLFSDRAWPPDDDLTVVPQEHRPWPFPALHRFHSYLSQRVALQTFQYVFSIDADMLFVDTVGDEVLEDLVAVLHPAFLSERGTPETNPESVAFIGPNEKLTYFAGAFFGGRASIFWQMAAEIAANIDIDLAHKMIAVWHEESHLNRWFVDHPPSKVLDVSYCYGLGFHHPSARPRLLTLDKPPEYKQAKTVGMDSAERALDPEKWAKKQKPKPSVMATFARRR